MARIQLEFDVPDERVPDLLREPNVNVTDKTAGITVESVCRQLFTNFDPAWGYVQFRILTDDQGHRLEQRTVSANS